MELRYFLPDREEMINEVRATCEKVYFHCYHAMKIVMTIPAPNAIRSNPITLLMSRTVVIPHIIRLNIFTSFIDKRHNQVDEILVSSLEENRTTFSSGLNGNRRIFAH